MPRRNPLALTSEVISGEMAATPTVTGIGNNGGSPGMTFPQGTAFVRRSQFEALGSREMATQSAVLGSPDSAINPVKPTLDAMGRDQALNDGYIQGAVNIHRDSVVGSQYLLNAKPNWRVLRRIFDPNGSDEKWQAWTEEWQEVVEGRFNLMSESPRCWLDASRRFTLTGMLRINLGCYVFTGEVLGAVEWVRDEPLRPFKTAFLWMSPDRLSNPGNGADEEFLRRGVVINRRGAPLGYHIRNGAPGTPWASMRLDDWKYVPAYKPWGRKQIIHHFEPMQLEQSRGVSEMVAVLKTMAMTKKFSETTLQKAVVNASYAAAIESELPSQVVAAALGAGGAVEGGPQAGFMNFIRAYMSGLESYLSQANNVVLNGTKIPHFFPGTKLVAHPLGQGQDVGGDFHAGLMRHIASGLGVSYEELTKDYQRLSYSGGKMSAANFGKHVNARKKMIADRTAGDIFECWAEEDMIAGNLPLPPGMTIANFYDTPYVREALFRCEWVGSGRDQIDELKETQAALMRIKSGISTQEAESAKLGRDWRADNEQQAREMRHRETLGLPPIILDATQTNTAGQGALEQDTGAGSAAEE